MTYTNHLNEVIEVGSIITAYRPGYHVVTEIEDRSKVVFLNIVGTTPLIHYTPLLTSKGTKAARSKQVCDAAYCRLAGPRIEEHIKELEDHISALRHFRLEHNLY
jgi:hypothetical protein